MVEGSVLRPPILIVDDDACCRALIAEALAKAGYATIEAGSGTEALLVVRRELALVILDVNLPGVSGYELCRRFREEHGSRLPIVFVSGDRTESYDRVAGLLLGADDYVAKPFSLAELVLRVRRLIERGTRDSGARAGLTRRELDVLRLLADGAPQQDIARVLVISPKTVGTHIEHILRKLGVRSRAQAVAVAYREQLLDAAGPSWSAIGRPLRATGAAATDRE